MATCPTCGGTGVQPGYERWAPDGRVEGPACKTCFRKGWVPDQDTEPGCVVSLLAKLFVYVGIPIAVLLVGAALYRNLTQDDPPDLVAMATDPPTGTSGSLVGGCVGDYVRGGPILGCEEEHTAEIVRIVGIQSAPEDPLPPRSSLRALAERECPGAATAYVGADPSSLGLSVGWLVPTGGGWDADERAITCVVGKGVAPFVVTTGSVRGKGG